MRRLLAGLTAEVDAPCSTVSGPDDTRGWLDRIPEPFALPAWLSQQDLDVYVAEFARTGFTGAINWYRNIDRNWHLTEALADARPAMPALFITGESDPVRTIVSPEVMQGWLLDLRGCVVIPDAGHWVQQERPHEVNEVLLRFLEGLTAG